MREHESREPFAYIIQDKYERERGVEGHLSRSHVSKYVSQDDINEHEITCTPLYRHAQQPVVPKSISVRQAISALESAGAVTTIGQAYKMGWNACRAAMLQELKKSAGTEATCRSNENAQVLTSSNPAPALVSLPKNAKSLTGNSPAIPDGYVMVPKEPTDEMIAAAMNCEDVLFNSDDSFCVQFGNIYEAMLAAAPQEVPDGK